MKTWFLTTITSLPALQEAFEFCRGMLETEKIRTYWSFGLNFEPRATGCSVTRSLLFHFWHGVALRQSAFAKSCKQAPSTNSDLHPVSGNLNFPLVYFNFLADKTIGTILDETSASLSLSPNLSDIQILAASSGGVSFDKTCPSNGSYDFWGFTLNSTLQTTEMEAASHSASKASN